MVDLRVETVKTGLVGARTLLGKKKNKTSFVFVSFTVSYKTKNTTLEYQSSQAIDNI